ncbi:MAG: YbhB/YbcL family Raf kinase inhibitor-like protein [Dehalococcoidales bacterium]|nr:MAG: YbhB/YbcL family Raf kinase inhibitor-like protein [Dehalococcoidales bacterium]
MTLLSTAFSEGENIPIRYSCDGEDISPQLTWDNVPAGTQSFVLIMDDPDAPGGVFTHWVLFNLPADARQLPEAVPTEQELDNGARHGINDFGEISYGGPCPPFGQSHRYQFTLYSLDTTLDLPAGASKQQVINAMQGHILDSVTLTGLYQS